MVSKDLLVIKIYGQIGVLVPIDRHGIVVMGRGGGDTLLLGRPSHCLSRRPSSEVVFPPWFV